MIDESRFEELWQQAGAGGRGRRLAGEYPAWRQRQRRAAGLAASLAVAAAVALPLLTGSPAHDNFDRVYCNHSGIPDTQWVSLAEDLLLKA